MKTISALQSLPFLILGSILMMTPSGRAADPAPNYDEAKVPNHPLPELLMDASGQPVTAAQAWRDKRRPEILRLFEEHVYGRIQPKPEGLSFQIQEVEANALGGLATRKQVRVRFANRTDAPHMDLLIYLPNAPETKIPVFLALNFYGNHSIHADPAILISESWMRNNDEFGVANNRASEKSRGVRASRWPVELILQRGYGLVTAYYGDIDPDFDDGFRNGVHPLLDPAVAEGGARAPDAWGSIGAWAWGLSRAMDYLESDDRVDARRVSVMGHSRLGKTSLWAGAQDERFALVISNNSGCGGAALNRRAFGETVGRINRSFPHWFCGKFKEYNWAEEKLPVDQHMLIALMAPRPVYVASAEEDRWADPRGEFLSCLHANPVYKLLGTDGLPAEQMPAVNQPVQGRIGYHIRTGKHDVMEFDWQQYMNFADKHLRPAK